LIAYNLWVFILCAIPAFLSIRSLIKVGIKPFSLCNVVFFMMFVAPILLDMYNGIPQYSLFPIFYTVSSNFGVNIFYSIFLIFGSWYFWLFRGKKVISVEKIALGRFVDIFLIIIMILPNLYFLFFDNKQKYYDYGGAAVRNFNEFEIFQHSIISGLTILSVVISGYLISKYISKSIIMILFLLAITIFDFWLNGKRAIVIFFIASYSLFIFLKYKNWKSISSILLLCLCFGIYTNWYQSTVRDFDASIPSNEKYENLRVDYSRDQRVKMAIYAEIFPERVKILRYRGQSFLMLMTFYVPREIWPEKPLTYAQYFTSAMYDMEPTAMGWGMTTTFFDESIANLSWFGFVFPFIFFSLFINEAKKTGNQIFIMYSTILILIMMTVQILAFIVLFLLWIFWFLKIKFYNRVVL